MMEDKDDWLKGLQNKMKDYEDPAPEGLWEDIESSVFPEKRHRVIAMPILWRSVTAAAVVALGVFAGLRLSDSFMEEPLDKAQETLASGQPSSVNSSGGQESSVELVRKPESETLLADSGSVTKRQGQASDVNNVKSALVTGMVVPEDEEKGVDAQSYVTEETLHGVASHARPQAKRPEEMTSEIEKSESGEEKSPVSISMDHEGEDWSNYISATDDLRTSRRNAATLDVAFSGGAMDSRDEILYDL